MDIFPRARPRPTRWTLALALAWSCKAAFAVWLIGHCESTPALHYLCADVTSWAGFLRSTHAGFVPYVDIWREYPAGIGTTFWALGALFGVRGIEQTLVLQASLSLVFDLVGALLLYEAAKPLGERTAAIVATASLLLPTAFLLSPVRYESLVAAVVLAGYLAHRRGKPLLATAIWSFGATLKWYPLIAIAIAELRVFDRSYLRERLPRVLGVAAGVQVIVNGPYWILGMFENGNIDRWLATYTFHGARALSPDTLLGMSALWLGPLPLERAAAWASMALGMIVLLTRRHLPLEPKLVITCAALLLLNRVYSPQFNLWFHALLLLVIAGRPRAQALPLVLLLGVVEISTLVIFPFAYARVLDELHGAFTWGAMAEHAGTFSHVFSLAIVLRAGSLLGLMAFLYRTPDEPPALYEARLER